MKSISTNDFKSASKFTGQCYGTKVTIELDHSDLDISELFDTFKGIALGLGFSENGWNEYIIESGLCLQDDVDDSEINLRHSNEHWNNPENWVDNDNQIFDWDTDEDDTFIKSYTDMEVFTNEILNPSEPNDELKQAAEKYKNELKDDSDGIQ